MFQARMGSDSEEVGYYEIVKIQLDVNTKMQLLITRDEVYGVTMSTISRKL